MMYTLRLTPESSGYTTTDADDVVITRLGGGAPRRRLDKLGSTAKARVSWVLNAEEFHYFRAFYRQIAGNGATPFRLTLVLDLPEPGEHTVAFVPGSVSLTQQRGNAYYVSAELDVWPNALNSAAESDLAAGYSEWGSNWEAQAKEFDDQLDLIVNVELPEIVNG